MGASRNHNWAPLAAVRQVLRRRAHAARDAGGWPTRPMRRRVFGADMISMMELTCHVARSDELFFKLSALESWSLRRSQLISNVDPLLDTRGAIVRAKDGNIEFRDGRWWMFGMSYGLCQEPDGPNGCANNSVGACGFRLDHNVSLYSSSDLGVPRARGSSSRRRCCRSTRGQRHLLRAQDQIPRRRQAVGQLPVPARDVRILALAVPHCNVGVGPRPVCRHADERDRRPTRAAISTSSSRATTPTSSTLRTSRRRRPTT